MLETCINKAKSWMKWSGVNSCQQQSNHPKNISQFFPGIFLTSNTWFANKPIQRNFYKHLHITLPYIVIKYIQQYQQNCMIPDTTSNTQNAPRFEDFPGCRGSMGTLAVAIDVLAATVRRATPRRGYGLRSPDPPVKMPLGMHHPIFSDFS